MAVSIPKTGSCCREASVLKLKQLNRLCTNEGVASLVVCVFSARQFVNICTYTQ